MCNVFDAHTLVSVFDCMKVDRQEQAGTRMRSVSSTPLERQDNRQDSEPKNRSFISILRYWILLIVLTMQVVETKNVILGIAPILARYY